MLVVGYLEGGPDDDRGDVERGVSQVNRTLASLGTLHAVPIGALPTGTLPVETAPDGARGIDIAALGAVCAALAPVAPDLLAALRSLVAWARERAGRTATVIRADGSRIDLTGLSEDDQHLLVADWLATRRKR